MQLMQQNVQKSRSTNRPWNSASVWGVVVFTHTAPSSGGAGIRCGYGFPAAFAAGSPTVVSAAGCALAGCAMPVGPSHPTKTTHNAATAQIKLVPPVTCMWGIWQESMTLSSNLKCLCCNGRSDCTEIGQANVSVITL